MVYVIFLCIALPLGLMLPILERRSRRLVFFLLLGMVSALVAYKLNSLLYPLSGLDVVQFSQAVPPVTEELLKALPILVFAVFFSDDRRDILPAAMSVGIGFSVLENTTLLVQNTLTATLYLAALRGLTASPLHALCTMIIGAGLPYLKKQKELFYPGIFGLFAVSVTIHALFNLLIQSVFVVLTTWKYLTFLWNNIEKFAVKHLHSYNQCDTITQNSIVVGWMFDTRRKGFRGKPCTGRWPRAGETE